MEQTKISIIVPVYNIEKYIGECIASILDQTYQNLEIILVDDEAKDGSPAICDSFAAQDGRIQVIHKKNGGAASARNAGIDAATGEYVCFVDGDDRIEKDHINQLWNILAETGADMATCGFWFWSRNSLQVRTGNTIPGVYDRDAYMLRFLEDWSCSLLWNKIFSRDVIGSIRMEEGHRVDDEFFTYQVCMNCRKIAVSDRCLYRYRLRASSAMQDTAEIQERVMLDRVAYNIVRYQHIQQRMPQLETEFFINVLDTFSRYWRHAKNMPTAQREIRHWVKAHTGRLLRLKLPLYRKLSYMKCLYLTKPTIIAEDNPILADPQEYFD